jgi:hypothetical protein
MTPHVRIVRPVRDVARSCDMYCHGLGLRLVGGVETAEGFERVILTFEAGDYQFEFSQLRTGLALTRPTLEAPLVLYMPSMRQWESSCRRMLRAGFKPVPAINPCCELCSRTYEDADGYRTVLYPSDVSLAPVTAPQTPVQ